MTDDNDEIESLLRERIQGAASAALSPWADPENDDWRDAAADQVADAVLADLRFGVICTACGSSDYTAEDHADWTKFNHSYLPAVVVRGVKPARASGSTPEGDDQ